MAKDLQPKKKIVPTNTQSLESGYMKASAEVKGDEIREHRLTIDIPNDLFDKMDSHRKETGQSYKGLVISLLKKHFS